MKTYAMCFAIGADNVRHQAQVIAGGLAQPAKQVKLV